MQIFDYTHIKRKAIILLLTSFCCISMYGQSAYPQRVYTIKEIQSDKIKIDGVLDEPFWHELNTADSFLETFPSDTIVSNIKTKVKMGFDKKNMYISAVCYDKGNRKIVAQSLKRDFSYPVNDAFAVYLCPQNDKTNGFNFTVSPLGVQREGIITNGGNNGVTTSWDNKWFSEVSLFPDSYVVEIQIPFKSIRYHENVREWGLNFSRQDLSKNINSTWNRVPRIFNIATLVHGGKMYWEKPAPKAGTNIVLIPYISGNYYRNFLFPEQNYRKPNIGSDFKVGVTSSLNLDVTINPDFAQVDVDDQVINLDRFEILFPEKRNFFIENSDLFANYGFTKIRPFFSRRIGLNNVTKAIVPIVGGVRLSGRLNPNWRIGAMNMQTSVDTFKSLTGCNYSVLALQRKIGSANNISFIAVDKEVLGNVPSEKNRFNRLLGFDYNIASPTNKYIGKVFFHQTLSPGKVNGDAYSHASWLYYNTQKLYWVWNHEYVGKNFNAEVGYVQRSAYWRLEPWIGYKFYPKNSPIWNHGPQLYLSQYFDLYMKQIEHLMTWTYSLSTKSHYDVNVTANDNYIYLQKDFDPKGANTNKLKAGTDYHFVYYTGYFGTDYRKKWREEINIRVGQYYNGIGYSYKSSFSYRFQPYAIFSFVFTRNETYLKNDVPVKYNLISPKLEITLNRKLFFTSYVQVNEQIQMVNINTRLQWRFKPMSDLFIVYNRNFNNQGSLYFDNLSGNSLNRILPQSSGFNAYNHSLIIKSTWWLNI